MTTRHMPDALLSLNDPRKSAIKIRATAVDDVRNPWELPWLHRTSRSVVFPWLRLQLRDRRRAHALDDDPRDHWHGTAGVHPGRHRDAPLQWASGVGILAQGSDTHSRRRRDRRTRPDMIRFGELLLNQGRWRGQQINPLDYARACGRLSITIRTPRTCPQFM